MLEMAEACETDVFYVSDDQMAMNGDPHDRQRFLYITDYRNICS